MTAPVKDSDRSHWVNRSPLSLRPYLQLSRLDRPVGYWLLALPGWIGLAFASLSYGFASSDLKWAVLILIGAIAMRGAGCTYNDIVDQDLDAQVERTALRPLPAGTVTTRQAWIWLFAQCAVGLIVLLCLPRLAQIISLASIPLVAAYPFMKRITWWPQVWLGMTFNWAVLVAYAAKTDEISPAALILYAGLIFWTVGYDTIYACQDIEDDMKIGVKSTARRFGNWVRFWISIFYTISFILTILAVGFEKPFNHSELVQMVTVLIFIPYGVSLQLQVKKLDPDDTASALYNFKKNTFTAILLIATLMTYRPLIELLTHP